MGIGVRIKQFFFVALRVKKYRWLSDCSFVSGNPKRYFPLLLTGKGKISFDQNVQIGVTASPGYYSGYSYVEARFSDSVVDIGADVSINNNFSAVAFSNITISKNVLIGVNCSIMDNDGHHLDIEKRNHKNQDGYPVAIGENVFIGDNVTILKGVSIGKNSVIGNGSVVTNNIGPNVIAAGNPAREIRKLND